MSIKENKLAWVEINGTPVEPEVKEYKWIITPNKYTIYNESGTVLKTEDRTLTEWECPVTGDYVVQLHAQGGTGGNWMGQQTSQGSYNVDFKYAGQKGQNGKNTGTAGTNDPWYSTKATGGKGASVSCCLRFDAITPSSVGAFITPKEDRGESYIEDSKANEKTYIISTYSGYAGAGGDGSPAFASYTYSTIYSHHITDGGKGGPGAVIIEYLG